MVIIYTSSLSEVPCVSSSLPLTGHSELNHVYKKKKYLNFDYLRYIPHFDNSEFGGGCEVNVILVVLDVSSREVLTDKLLKNHSYCRSPSEHGGALLK